jgi:3-carboxy-cis,cis-muconate cycloisomerase
MDPVSLFDFRTYAGMFTTGEMSSIFCERETIRRMVDVERAVSRVQGNLGIIPADAAEHIAETVSADGIDLERLHRDTLDVGRPIVGLQQQLAGQVEPAHAPWVHFGITTYDIMDTARSLQVRDALSLILSQMRTCRDLLADIVRTHRDTPMIGRTNNLHAQPNTFGAKLATWLEEMLRHEERLRACRPRVEVVQMGGAVGTLASLHPHGLACREGVARELGLGTVQSNWHNARDSMTEAALCLSNLCASLARIAENINQLSGTDFGETSEAGKAGRGRSTSMPHKRNPRAAEFAEAVARLGRQRGVGMVEIMGQSHDRNGGTYICEWMILPETFLLTSGALSWMSDLLQRLEIHPDRMRDNIDALRGLALTERYTLALARHMSKFDARRLVDEACARTFESDLKLADVLKTMPEVAASLGENGIDALSQPESYVGAAPEIVDRVLALHAAASAS